MIFVGYYGIGKSTLCERNPTFIDLESKFFRDRNNDTGWLGGKSKGLNNYIWLVKTLNDSGRHVFVSSDGDIRFALLNEKDLDRNQIVYICPEKNLKDVWLSKLYKRWVDTSDRKDWFSYIHATKKFKEDIESMEADHIKTIWIKDAEYDLNDLISGVIKNDKI